MKDNFKFLYILLRLIVLLINKRNNLIFSIYSFKLNNAGPLRFMNNLVYGLKNYKVKISKRTLFIISYLQFPCLFNIAKFFNIRTITRIDGFSTYYNLKQKKNRIREEKIGLAIKKSDIIVYQSLFSKKMADLMLSKRKLNYQVIYNGVDINHFDPSKIVHSPNQNDIIRICTLGDHRDPELMLSYLNSLKYIQDREYQFTIIGNLSNNVKKQFKNWKYHNKEIASKITLMGFVNYENLPYKILENDIALQAKAGDWCPNAVLELLGCGIPIVYNNYGGTIELVENAGIGIEHPPFIYNESYSKKIYVSLLKIQKNLNRYKTLARERAITKFSLEVMINNYKKILS